MTGETHGIDMRAPRGFVETVPGRAIVGTFEPGRADELEITVRGERYRVNYFKNHLLNMAGELLSILE